MPGKLFCFGLGYSARHLIRLLQPEGWQVGGSVRHPDRLAALAAAGIAALLYDAGQPFDKEGLDGVTHLLQSIPPGREGDSVLADAAPALARAAEGGLQWIGYLSTTGVYGNHDGGWVTEDTPPNPTAERSARRVRAEQAWLEFGAGHRVKTQIFRLAGIYGPGRSVIEDVRAGSAQRLIRPGHLFSRIHVADIARVLRAAMTGASDARIFNVCDDQPASSAEVVSYACSLLGVEPPPEVPFDPALLSPMAQSFWADNKRVDNRLLYRELGVSLLYPSYREGLAALTTASAESSV